MTDGSAWIKGVPQSELSCRHPLLHPAAGSWHLLHGIIGAHALCTGRVAGQKPSWHPRTLAVSTGGCWHTVWRLISDGPESSFLRLRAAVLLAELLVYVSSRNVS